ncbi:MAG TPA: hypothetical protein VLD57_00155, partial [Blastocatellia bacterium]|nr:hypothetical protein [Blastocatellia bacterium]
MDTRLLVILTSLLFGLSLQRASAQSFRAQQMSYPRVRAAAAEKETTISSLFSRNKISFPPARIFI